MIPTNLKSEKTFVMIKPDAVCRGIVGEIITRFEQRYLKVLALEMVSPTREMMDNHYPKDPAWVTRLGQKMITTFDECGIDPVKIHGTNNPEKLGPMVREWLLNYFTMGPIVKMVVEGSHAVDMARKIIGATMPYMADVGTIRGDYSVDSPAIANVYSRVVFNIVHASETAEEAEHEIKHWFGDQTIHSYKRFGIDE